MTFVVDARKLPCPQPVVLTIKAMEESDDITTIVSSKIAKENVTRLARDRGFSLEVTIKGDEFHMHMARLPPGEKAYPDPVILEPKLSSDSTECRECNGNEDSGARVLLLTSDAIGQGDEELGKRLMTSFLQILGEVPQKPTTIIFMNSAVKLVVKGAPALEDLRDRERQGVKLLACGTCLSHYELMDAVAVGQVSNMYDIASILLNANKVVSP